MVHHEVVGADLEQLRRDLQCFVADGARGPATALPATTAVRLA